MNAVLNNCLAQEELSMKRLHGITDGAVAEPIGPGVAGDKIMKVIVEQVSELVEINLERLQVSDTGLTAISKCSILEILHLMETPKCTNNGLNTVSQNCKLLRKLYIDGWKTNRISDDGLIVVAKHCPNITNLKPIFSYQDFLN
ncbi:hypothetical protein KY285_010510 [Solanum tuberosum]|nr:hypothetical protein KY289_011054 [Solanum tuberosum]KAH0734803.1 hypothetical protein KY285_010510 [Solanum tuberosum]